LGIEVCPVTSSRYLHRGERSQLLRPTGHEKPAGGTRTPRESSGERFRTPEPHSGHHVPGIFMIDPRARMSDLMKFLVLAAYASDVLEWRDQIRYVP
jgi:hypothetical protein